MTLPLAAVQRAAPLILRMRESSTGQPDVWNVWGSVVVVLRQTALDRFT